jgi:CheY-like chemotaxis protein
MTVSEHTVSGFARDVAELAPFILVVDDDPEFRDWLARKLGEAGFNVIEASSGDMAVALCQTARPGGVVMDNRFPKGGYDGRLALEAIRRLHPDHGGLSAVLVTEYPDDIDVKDYPVLRKPDLDAEREQVFGKIYQKFFKDIKKQVAGIVEQRFSSAFDRLTKYEAFFGPIENYSEPVKRYDATVVDVEMVEAPDAVLIEYLLPEGTKKGRLLPRGRVDAVKAGFEGARIDYQIYDGGAISLSRVERIGKSIDEISEEDFPVIRQRPRQP